MILELIMDAIKAVILFVIRLFPTLPEMNFIKEWVNYFGELLLFVNRFVYLRVLGICLITILICYNLRLIWSSIIWVLRKIPGVS